MRLNLSVKNIYAILLLCVLNLISCLSCSTTKSNKKLKPILPVDSFIKFDFTINIKNTEIPLDSGQCSGFSIKTDSTGTYGLTNFHCLGGSSLIELADQPFEKEVKLKIHLSDDTYHPAIIIKTDEFNDLALFFVKNIFISSIPIMNTELPVGSHIWNFGIPFGWTDYRHNNPTIPIQKGIYNGIMTSYNNRTLEVFTLKIAPGSSGSPVVTWNSDTKQYELYSVIHTMYMLGENLGPIAYDELAFGCGHRALVDFIKGY